MTESSLYKSSIGQMEGISVRKCPIEELYRTNGRSKREKVSDRRALSTEREVQA